MPPSLGKGRRRSIIGPLVACQTKKGTVLRRRPQRTKPPTENEKQNRHIFGLTNRWIKPISGFIQKGFRGYSEKCEGRQATISEIFNNGLERKGFESVIHPERVLVSWGKIGLPEEMRAQLDSDGNLRFEWRTEGGTAKDTRDRSMLMAYKVTAPKAAWDLSGPNRHVGVGNLSLQWMSKRTFDIYLAFAAEYDKGQSMSKYLGMVVK